MTPPRIDRWNVGKISERIVMNELEQRGYLVTDLNKDRTAPNADLVAFKDNKFWLLQVKGSSASGPNWGLQFGYVKDEVTDRIRPMYNRSDTPYRADFVVLSSVRSATNYRCFVLPVLAAERVAQELIDMDYRLPTKSGERKKPSKLYLIVDAKKRERESTTKRYEGVRAFLSAYDGSHDESWELEAIAQRCVGK